MRKSSKARVAKLQASGKEIKMNTTNATTNATSRKFCAADGSAFLLPASFPDSALRAEIAANWKGLSVMTPRGAYAEEIRLLLTGFISQDDIQLAEIASEGIDANVHTLAREMRFEEIESNFYKMTGFTVGECMALDLQEKAAVSAAAVMTSEDAEYFDKVIRINGKFSYVGRGVYSDVFNGACASRRSLVPARVWAARLSTRFHPSFVAYIALRVWSMNASEL